MNKIIENFEEYVIAVLICGMILLEAINAVMHVLGAASLGLPEELAIYCYVWIAFMSVAFCAKKGCNVSVNMLLSKYSARTQRTLAVVCEMINIFLSVCLLAGAVGFIQKTIEADSKGSLSGIPMAIVYCSSVLGYLLCLVRNIQNFATIIKHSDKN